MSPGASRLGACALKQRPGPGAAGPTEPPGSSLPLERAPWARKRPLGAERLAQRVRSGVVVPGQGGAPALECVVSDRLVRVQWEEGRVSADPSRVRPALAQTATS